MRKQILILLGMLFWGGALCASPVDDYRAAIEKKDWVGAWAATKDLTAAEPASALQWYRRARAAAFSGDRTDAREALTKAKTLDPSLSFTQDPARVQVLEARIAALSLPILASAPAVASTSEPGSVTAAVTPTVAEPTMVATLAPPQTVQLPVAVPESTGLKWMLAVAIGLSLGGIGIGIWHGFQVHATRKTFEKFLADAATTRSDHERLEKLSNVFEAMARAQKQTHLLAKLLEDHKLTESAIYAAVCEFQPVLDRNIGMAPLHQLELRGIIKWI